MTSYAIDSSRTAGCFYDASVFCKGNENSTVSFLIHTILA